MSRSGRWTQLRHTSWTLLGWFSLLVACVVITLPRENQFLELYREAVRFATEDILGMGSDGANAPAYTRNLPLIELKHMLASESPGIRASAVQAMGERQEQEVFTALAQLLNDTEVVRIGEKQVSISQLSKQSLSRFIRTRITQQPGNIAILIPYLSGIQQGTPLQRSSFIEIVGEIREPLARPLLVNVAQSEPDLLVQSAAKRALARIDSHAIDSDVYRELRANQRRVGFIMICLTCVLVLFMLYHLAKGEKRRLGFLALIPVLICGGFAVLASVEHWRGRLDAAAVDTAIRSGNVMIVRTAAYHDQTEFPGDSYMARHLVQMNGASALKTLNATLMPEPDDLDSLRHMTETRQAWILSRILGLRLGTPELQNLILNTDPETKLAILTAVDKLMVTDHEIIAVLKLLENDEDEQVKNKAAEVIARSRNYTTWSVP
jgi:hypothetical protein